MESYKTYRIIIPYTESASTSKKYKVEYLIEAENRSEALQKAEKEFNSYSLTSSASWIRIPDESSIRAWRVFPNDPITPQFIDEIIGQIPCETKEQNLQLLKRLGELEDTTASSKILLLTKEEDPELVATAIITLGLIGDTSSFFAVKNAYNKENQLIKQAVIETLIKLALPEDNAIIIDFYRNIIHNENTREFVFNLKNSALLPLWLAEISNEKEFELVKNTILKIGEKSVDDFITLASKHPQVLDYATKLVDFLNPIATKYQWKDWPEVMKKYKHL